jgi:hypothetical protein
VLVLHNGNATGDYLGDLAAAKEVVQLSATDLGSTLQLHILVGQDVQPVVGQRRAQDGCDCLVGQRRRVSTAVRRLHSSRLTCRRKSLLMEHVRCQRGYAPTPGPRAAIDGLPLAGCQ